jgi:hypothetical protein
MPGKAGANVRILRDVQVVVEVEKWCARDRVVKGERCKDEQQREN